MKAVFFLLIFNFINLVKGQQLHHEMISAQGGKSVTTNGYVVKYTIGQQSVTGTSVNGFVVQQGFQQSNWGKLIDQNTVNINTLVYPNPFTDYIKFSFSMSPGEQIDVLIYDVLGKLVYSEKAINESNVITLDLKKLSSAEYLVRLSSGNFIQSVKIIKQ